MATWNPPSEVGEKELVGRRLFDKTIAERSTAEDGTPLLRLNDFHEKREEDDLSVDRLGDPNPSKGALTAITSLADEDASLRHPKFVFNGWATIRVQDFFFPGWVAQITATPVLNEDGTVENPWHADVNRDGYREKAYSYTLAATLQHIFERKGGYQPPVRN